MLDILPDGDIVHELVVSTESFFASHPSDSVSYIVVCKHRILVEVITRCSNAAISLEGSSKIKEFVATDMVPLG